MTEGAGRFFNVGLALLAARVLGPAAWGLYWAAFGLAHLVSLLTDLGSHFMLARTVARRPRAAPGALAASTRLKLLLAAGTLAAGLVLLAAGAARPAGLALVLLTALVSLSFVEWMGYYLRGLGRVREEAMWLGGNCAIAFGCGALGLRIAPTPFGLAVSQLVAHGATLAAIRLYVRATAPRAAARPNPGEVRDQWRGALPIGAAGFISLASWRLGAVWLPSLLLATGGPLAAVGLYAAAHRLLEVARFLPTAAAGALFPDFARGRAGWPPAGALIILVPVALAFAAGGWLPPVGTGIRLVLGEAYAGAVPLLRALLCALPLMTANAVLTHWLVARGRVGANAALSGVHLAVHAACLWVAVPRFGVRGAAWSLVVAEAALCSGTLACWLRLKERAGRA